MKLGYMKDLFIDDVKVKSKEKTCDNCSKRKTIKCPNSAECHNLEAKPHWKE